MVANQALSHIMTKSIFKNLNEKPWTAKEKCSNYYNVSFRVMLNSQSQIKGMSQFEDILQQDPIFGLKLGMFLPALISLICWILPQFITWASLSLETSLIRLETLTNGWKYCYQILSCPASENWRHITAIEPDACNNNGCSIVVKFPTFSPHFKFFSAFDKHVIHLVWIGK